METNTDTNLEATETTTAVLQEPTLLVEAPEVAPSAERQLEYWRETALFAEKTIIDLMRAKSMHERTKVFNQCELKRNDISYKYLDVLQHLFQKK